MEQAQYKIILNETQFNSAINKAIAGAQRLDNSMRGVNNSAQKTESVFAGMLKFNVFSTLASSATALITSSFETAKQIDSINRALKVTSGSAVEYNKNIKFIEESAESMGLEILSTKEAFKMLSASTMGTNLQGKQTRSIFASVANASSKLGVSVEDTKGMFLALAQMISKNKLSSEELRQQLGEKLPGSFGIAASAMGVTTQQLDKMLQKGEVISEDFLPKFANALNKKFGDPMKANADSISANSNRIMNIWTDLKASTLGLFSGLMSGLMSFVRLFKTYLGEIKLAFKPISDAITLFKNEMNGAFDNLKKGKSTLDLFKSAINSIAYALDFLSPIFNAMVKWTATIYKAIINIVTAIVAWVDRTTWLKTGLKVIWSTFVSLFTYIATFATEVLGGLSDSFAALFNGDWAGMKKGAGRLVKAMYTAGSEGAKAFEHSFNTTKKDLFAGTKKTKAQTVLEQDTYIADNLLNGGTAGTGGGTGIGGKSNSAETAVSGVSSARAGVVNIRIDKLIETFNTSISNMSASQNEITEMVSRALLTAVNDVNLLTK
jgi:tape measure domain-containing protein